MSAIVVTGGAGFIGSALVRLLVGSTGHTVVNVDKLTYAGNLGSLAQVESSRRYHFVHADICDAEQMASVFETHKPSALIHLAAESHVDRSIDAPAQFVDTNVVGTFTLLREARRYCEGLSPAERGAFRFIHVSTDEVFGSLGASGHFTEATPYSPNSPYAATKAASDHLVRAWFQTYGLPTIVTNCSNNFGPCQFPEKLIPLVILHGIEGRKIPVYGRGENVRDWLYVDDHAAALLRVLERGKPGETYNIGCRNERKNIDVVRSVCRLLDELSPSGKSHDSLIEFVTDRPGHDLRYAIDPTKVERELGWRAAETFDSGLRRTVEWYLANLAWCEHVRRGEHWGERLGKGVHA